MSAADPTLASTLAALERLRLCGGRINMREWLHRFVVRYTLAVFVVGAVARIAHDRAKTANAQGLALALDGIATACLCGGYYAVGCRVGHRFARERRTVEGEADRLWHEGHQ